MPFHNGTKTKEQSQQAKHKSIGKAMYAERPKCTLRSLSELRGMPDIKINRKHEVWKWMTLILSAYFRLVSAPICLNLLLLLPAALEELIYELTFLRQYDHNNLILG